MPDNQYITPAEAHESTNEKMIRIPEQFPNPPVTGTEVSEPWTIKAIRLQGDQPDSSHENVSIINIIGNGEVVSGQSFRIDLDESNFHPVTNLCVVRISQYAGEFIVGVAGHATVHAQALIEKIVEPTDYLSFVVAKYGEAAPVNWDALLISVNPFN